MAVAPEPLRGRSLPELREMLRRQEKLLGDRKFMSRLPDKGKKIADFAEKLKIAILQEEEIRRTAELLSDVRLEFQEKREAIESSKQKTVVSSKSASQDPFLISEYPAPCVNNEVKSALQKKQSVLTKKTSKANKSESAKQTLEDTNIPQGNKTVSEGSIARLPGEVKEAPGHNSVSKDENPTQSASRNSEALVDVFERMSVGKGQWGKISEEGQRGHPFQSLPNTPPKPPHYTEVLEWRVKNPVTKRSNFKTNILPAESSRLFCASPTISSARGPPSSFSAEERRRRDKKHLDDITAARLPPLHHEPMQLLSLEDSIAIQIQQKEAYEEMQAKLAAQKLAERLGVKMACYEPEGEMVSSYREVRDEECDSSAED